jgi:hypothetical protein
LILLISASQVARITGMSHQCWASSCFCLEGWNPLSKLENNGPDSSEEMWRWWWWLLNAMGLYISNVNFMCISHYQIELISSKISSVEL